MTLVGPWLSTTSTKKRKEKITKAKQEELDRGWRERNIRLRDMGLPKETYEQYLDWVYGRGQSKKKTERAGVECKMLQHKKVNTPVTAMETAGQATGSPEVESSSPKSLGLWVTGAVTTKQSPVYTGTKIIGIGTMHKSNAVPIFSDNEAKEISSMRR